MRPHGKVDRFHQCVSGNSDDYLDGGYKRKELEPQRLFVDLALLIREARQPELSERGRVQGPHCPQLTVSAPSNNAGGDCDRQSSAGAAASKSTLDLPQNKHVCDETNENCVRAQQIESELGQLWSRGIPACLTVSLVPEECSKQENCIAEALLIEKWTIQPLEKRTREDKLLPGQFLIQAVSSHLHFSQLSAWLIASRGKFPTNIIYRVCLPGELETSVTSQLNTSNSESPSSLGCFEKHQFPLCSAGKHLCLSVSVESMPRCEKVSLRACYCLRPSTSGISRCSTDGATAVESNTDVAASNAIASSVSSSQSSFTGSRDDRPMQIGEEGISGLVIDDEREIVGDIDTPAAASPLDSRSDSYQSFYEDRTGSPPAGEAIGNDASSNQQPVYVPLNLPPLVCSTSAQYSQKKIYATNPLFEAPAPTLPSFLNNKYSTKSRVEASKLRNEGSLLKAELRAFAATATANFGVGGIGLDEKHSLASSSNTSRTGGFDDAKPRFFVADGDEEEEEVPDGHCARSHKSEVPEQRYPDSKEAKHILFSDEKELLTNDDVSFSDWISQATTAGDNFAAILGDGGDLSNENEDYIEQDREPALPKVDFKDAQNRASNESTCSSKVSTSGHARKARRTLTFGGTDARVQFNPKTGLPLSSSPAPLKRNHSSFNYDPCITSVSALKSALYAYDHESGGSSDSDSGWPLCKSAPASTNLLGSFEESALNGRIKPFGTVDGFSLELGASGAFCPTHVTLPVTTLFFNVSDDNAPSPYFGLCSLESIGRRGYYVPKKGSVQATLFNPQGMVVKMFVVRYDLCDMPPACQTFVRQRTFFMPSSATLRDAMANRSWLRYLIHLRFASSRSGKLFLHTDIRMLFSRKSELEAYNFNCVDGGTSKNVDTYELRSFTEMPKEPKFSPRKLNRNDKERNVCR